MPVYEYKCRACEKVTEKITAIKDYTRVVTCECGAAAYRVFLTAPRVQGDYAAYDCPITGKRIEGRKAHEENLRKHGCRVYEPGETEGFQKSRAAEEAAFEESVGETAAQFVAGLPSEKREQLAKELESGADVSVDRK